MIREMKISLTFQKQAYAVFFVVILSLVRGITYSDEIGIALRIPNGNPCFHILCRYLYAGNCQQAIGNLAAMPHEKRMHSIYRHIVIQEMFLLAVAATSYGLFFLFQNPNINGMGQSGIENEICQFFVYFAAIAVTLGFWGLLSNLFSCLFRNMWVGIGGCMVLWLITNSSIGDRTFKAWNLFSYAFRKLENSSDFSWICGKVVCICIGIMAVVALPKIIKKRG